MASVDWLKLHTPEEVKRIMRHNDRELRFQDGHGNTHINKNLTVYNLQNCDYDTACRRYDERIAYLDSKPKSNKRKDRTTAISLIIPIPNEIPDCDVGDFANKCNRMFTKRFGLKNMIASYVHIDEVHDYIDSSTKQTRTSMRHMHVLFVPEQDEKLNGKAVCCKKNMIAVNNEVHEMTMRDYGVQFMDGSKQKSKESVEGLKLRSKALEIEERENLVEQREESVAQQEIDVEARERAVAKRESEVDVIYKAAYKKLSEADEKLSEVTQREQDIAKREKSIKQAETSMTVKLSALQRRADELEEKELEYEQKMQRERKEMLRDVEQRERIVTQRENELADKQKNFKREVQKAAQSIVERQSQATATLSDMQKTINNQLDMLPNTFDSND